MNVAMKQVHRGAKLRLVKSGSIAAGDNKLDYTSDNSFIEFGVDISAYHGNHKIVVTDSAGKSAEGYLHSVAPGGEAYAADLLLGLDLTVGWNPFNITINDADTYTIAGAGGIGYCQKNFVTVGTCYKSSLDASGTGGAGTAITGSGGPAYVLDGQSGKYVTADDTAILFITYGSAGQVVNLDTKTVEPLTDCAATGALIVSTLGGATRAWTSVDSGFNPNLACEYKIFRVR